MIRINKWDQLTSHSLHYLTRGGGKSTSARMHYRGTGVNNKTINNLDTNIIRVHLFNDDGIIWGGGRVAGQSNIIILITIVRAGGATGDAGTSQPKRHSRSQLVGEQQKKPTTTGDAQCRGQG
jgi:hypothetical protein